MTTVLAAIDDTPTADRVLDAASALAAAMDARLEAVHVRETPAGAAVASDAAASRGITCRMEDDPVPETLTRLAGEDEVVALVLGARNIPSGASAPGHVAVETLVAVGKPVLIVPPDTSRPARLQRVLVPLDGTLQTADALAAAIEFACDSGMHVRIVHVHDESCFPRFEDQPQHESAAWADEFLRRYCSGKHLPVVIRVGVPAEEILATSAENDDDLVMLAWSRNLAGGRARVVRELLARSRLPLLLFPT